MSEKCVFFDQQGVSPKYCDTNGNCAAESIANLPKLTQDCCFETARFLIGLNRRESVDYILSDIPTTGRFNMARRTGIANALSQ